MEWLNYHHLYYFWCVARIGGLRRASEELRLSPPTISAQLHTLEATLGEKLFARSGRNLVLTDVGNTVYRYADEIFTLGSELLDTVKSRPTGRPLRLTIGIANIVPKLLVMRLIEPAFHLRQQVQIVCKEGNQNELLAGLAAHDIDIVLSDVPLDVNANVRAFTYELGESMISFMAAPKLLKEYKAGFPKSLDGAPMLLPSVHSGVRRSLDHWFSSVGVRPRIVGEFDDYALLRIFAEAGKGIAPAPAVVVPWLRGYGLRQLGATRTVYGRFYAIAADRRIKNPAVVAICEQHLSRVQPAANAAAAARIA